MTSGAARRAAFDRGALEHYADPAYYARAYRSRRQDVAFYVARAKQCRGSVLEYGVGNGRVALPIARAGIEIVGIDLSLAMLGDLERRAGRLPAAERRRLSWVHGDMRSVRLDRRFELVIAPFNTILHLYERADVERFLAGVRAHLAPGGSFLFDYSIPIAADLVEDPEVWRDGPRIRVPGSSSPVRYRERFEYDVLSQVLLVEMAFLPPGRAAWSTLLSHRQFFPREMEALLYYNGFSDIRFTADFTRNAPAPDVDSLVVEARAAQVATPRRRP